MNYGMPYIGSKNRIAEKIIDSLPSATHFYDCFGGGGAISHCAYLSGKYKYVHYNELDPLIFKGFKMAINGEFKDEKRWISREDFNKLKDTDPYVAFCFSFGNCIKSYAYNEETEKFKKAVHYSIVFDDNSLLKEFVNLEPKFTNNIMNDRRLELQKFLRPFSEQIKKFVNFNKTGSVENISQNLGRLNRINKIGKLNIMLNNKSYDEIEFENDSVIYCDPPYKDTGKYRMEFDHSKFYEWAKKQNNIFISEYQLPDEFKEFKTFNHVTSFAQKHTNKTIENIYVNSNYKVFNNLEDW